MKHIIFPLIMASSLFSCSMIDNAHIESLKVADVNKEKINREGEPEGNFRFTAPKREENANERIFLSKELPNNINFYMRGLMQDLVSNLQYVNERTPIAVTSFVFLDSDLERTSLLGNQMSESLIHEIHKVGIPVLDFKVTDSLRITQEGDFISSRDFKYLNTNIPIQYIVTGNLVKHQGGYLVNARVVGISSKAVVASAQSFIPAHVAKALLSSKPVVTSAQEIGLVPLVQGQ
jgi:TolB-like protein